MEHSHLEGMIIPTAYPKLWYKCYIKVALYIKRKIPRKI